MSPRQFITIAVSLICFSHSGYTQPYAVLSGVILNAREDSITFRYNDNGKGIFVKTRLINNFFNIRIKISGPSNIEISDGIGYISGIIEPRDSIIIHADFSNEKLSPEFAGRGKGKFIYRQSYTSLFPLLNERITAARLDKSPVDFLLSVIDSVENSYLQSLNSFRNDMSKEVYLIFRGDLEGYLWQVRSQIPSFLYNKPLNDLIKRNSDSITIKFQQQQKSFINFKEAYYKSGIYVLTVAGTLDAIYKSNFPDSINNIEYKYKYISQHLPPKLRIPVISNLLTEDIKSRQNRIALESVIKQTFKSSSDSVSKNNFTKILNDIFQLKEGEKAPDFKLENTRGEDVRLSDFNGKVIYMDFWFADCAPCHQLFKQLKSVKEYFKADSNVVFLNISIDNKEVWQKTFSKFKIEGYHVFTEGKEATHQVINDYQVYGYPTNRLIDRKGKFFIIVPSDNPEELIKQINEALKN